MTLFKEELLVARIAAHLILTAGLVLILPSASRHAHADDAGCGVVHAGETACGVEPIGSYSPTQGSGRLVANPVDVISGAKSEERIDYRAFGSRLSFTRRYNSAAGGINRGIGVNWRHAYDLSLSRLADNSGPSSGLRLMQANGIAINFYKHGTIAGRWDSHEQRYGSITLKNQHYQWAVPDGRNMAFPGARPTRIEWPDGDVLKLHWQNDALLRVEDRHDRALTLHWTPGPRPTLRSFEEAEEKNIPGHLEHIELPDGTSISYRYDNLHRLRAVYPADEASEQYRYDDSLESALIALSDAKGTRQWHYRQDGRVDQFTERDGRTLTFEYRDNSTDVIREDGTTVTYDWHADDVSGAVLDRVVEYPCTTCRGEALDITPRKSASESTIDKTLPAAPIAIEGVRLERLGKADADVYVVALDERINIHFDRQAKVRAMRTLDATSDKTRSPRDLAELIRVRRHLDASSTADTRSKLVFNGQPTTSVCPLPITRTCAELQHDRDLARISQCAYQNGPCDVPGWTQLEHAVIYSELGVDPAKLERKNFRAVIYRNNQTGEDVVGFRGTQEWDDYVVDINQFEGRDTPIYGYARELAQALDRAKADVTFTGHSLGGGLATAAALTSHQQAIGFNSAALTERSAERHGSSIKDADHLVTHLLVPGEWVTSFQETPMRDPRGSGPHNDYGANTLPWETHPAPGRRDMLEPPSQAAFDRAMAEVPTLARVILTESVETSVALHSMISVISSLDETIAARCTSTQPVP